MLVRKDAINKLTANWFTLGQTEDQMQVAFITVNRAAVPVQNIYRAYGNLYMLPSVLIKINMCLTTGMGFPSSILRRIRKHADLTERPDNRRHVAYLVFEKAK
jgi:hypothetical protein